MNVPIEKLRLISLSPGLFTAKDAKSAKKEGKSVEPIAAPPVQMQIMET
jgi:hypothetical protein